MSTDKLRERALEFQQRLTENASVKEGKIWWASIRFPDELAALLEQVAVEARLKEHRLNCGRCAATGEDPMWHESLKCERGEQLEAALAKQSGRG